MGDFGAWAGDYYLLALIVYAVLLAGALWLLVVVAATEANGWLGGLVTFAPGVLSTAFLSSKYRRERK